MRGAPTPTRADDGIFSIAIVGRPNVGKSTLFNRLVGEERSVVHDMPGTTRDAIDTVVETEDGPLRFVDTAGLRRKSQIDEPSEYYSLVRALEAIDRADAALFVIDASEGVTHQDQRLAERVDAAGTAVVIVLNKWDLLDAEDREQGAPRRSPTCSASCATRRCSRSPRSRGRRVHQLLPALREAESAYHQRIPTAVLNRVLRDAQAAHPPPIVKKHRPRILYAHPGRDRSADVHAVRDAAAVAAVPALPRAQACASRSTSARRRSRSASDAAPSDTTASAFMPAVAGGSRSVRLRSTGVGGPSSQPLDLRRWWR